MERYSSVDGHAQAKGNYAGVGKELRCSKRRGIRNRSEGQSPFGTRRGNTKSAITYHSTNMGCFSVGDYNYKAIYVLNPVAVKVLGVKG